MSDYNCITDVDGIMVGQVTDLVNLTGCTVVLCKEGATCGIDIKGGAPGSRECSLLNPLMSNDKVHAVFLSGGSSYGLSVGEGVMQYLEEQKTGFETQFGKIPIVPGAVLFDLSVGNSQVRPNNEMGYLACKEAQRGKIKEGNYGAGTGATVGKVMGFQNCMKGGIGSASIRMGNDVTVGAIVAVNSFGDIRNPKTGQIIAGPLFNNKPQDTLDMMIEQQDMLYSYHMNTTLAVVATNAEITKPECAKVSQIASNGLSNTIYPYGTTLDGDTVFTLSYGKKTCDINLLGVLAGKVLSEAVINAISKAESVCNIKSYKEIFCSK
ncbi:MAG: P1 family peptidase [Anaerocolumna sp.]